jgi:hypothetical protein
MHEIDRLWETIVRAACSAQITDGEFAGLVKNPIINGFYHRETAFAAKIFAVEWKRTHDQAFLQRARQAINALDSYLRTHPVTLGIDEPTLTPRGLRYRKGSIPATILLVYAAQEASRVLEENFRFDFEGLLSYLARCHMGGGKYYHDAIAENGSRTVPHVVNTSAMAYLFYAFLLKDERSADFEAHKKDVVRAIIKAQRSDGFWPYLDTGYGQRVFYSLSRFIPGKALRVYNGILSDHSIFFGDGVHHCITLYYLLKGASSKESAIPDHVREAIMHGWEFLRRHLVTYDTNYVRFDFSWEPKPRVYRHCNFIDTSTYFYIFDILQTLGDAGLLPEVEVQKILEGMARHILKSLVDDELNLNGYEGDSSIIDMIIPRPSESVFDKGFFLSNTVLKRIAHVG